MRRFGPGGVVRVLLPLLFFGLALAQFAAFWPGIMIWDAIRQYGQALSGQYDDWHPPAMSWLWRRLLVFGPGPAAMLVVQVVLYWSGFALLADWAARAGRAPLAFAIAACALLPVPFVLMGVPIKDALMAGCLLTSAGLMTRRPVSPWLWRSGAVALLLAAATLRFNALPACLPLAVHALPERWRQSWPRLALATLAAAIPLALALPLANHALGAGRSGVEKSLIIYDLAGITSFSGRYMLPDVGVDDPVAVVRACYSPIEWDRYAWWGDAPCAIGFETVGPALDREGRNQWRILGEAILHHPIAYAAHRLDHFNSEERFLIGWNEEQEVPLASDPNDWGFGVVPGPLLDAFRAITTRAVHGPLGWPACWLALGLGLLMLMPVTGAPIALPLLLSALLYDLSYLPLGVASELRYRCWQMMAIAIVTVLALAAPGTWRRRAFALGPLLLVAAAGVAARAVIA